MSLTPVSRFEMCACVSFLLGVAVSVRVEMPTCCSRSFVDVCSAPRHRDSDRGEEMMVPMNSHGTVMQTLTRADTCIITDFSRLDRLRRTLSLPIPSLTETCG